MLDQHPDNKVRVFAVWEPILPIDWGAPTTSALHRLSDHRVTQFWDKQHLLAKVMAESLDPESKPDCCSRHGILWDLIAVYPGGTLWVQSLPPATVFNGPVVRVVAGTKIL